MSAADPYAALRAFLRETKGRRPRYTVALRRGPGFVVKAEAEPLQGRTFHFQPAWPIEGGMYEGETAMLPHDDEYPIGAPHWIASGDLVAAN